MLGNVNMKGFAEKAANSEDFAKNIKICFKANNLLSNDESKNLWLMDDAIELLVMMLDNVDTKVAADKIVKDCMVSNDPRLKFFKINLLIQMLYNKNTKVLAERIINGEDFSKFAKDGIGSKSRISQLKEDTIRLLVMVLGNVDTKVTAAIEASNLKVEDGAGNDVSGLYLICDAPEGQAGLLPGEGIYWSTKADGSDKITTLTLIGSVNEADHDIADIETYDGHFASTATSAVSGTYVNIEATTALDATVTSTSKNANVSTTFTLPAVSYASVPTSVAQVTALQAEVAALSLTFAFTFNVAAIN
jgi:hypothetical protein